MGSNISLFQRWGKYSRVTKDSTSFREKNISGQNLASYQFRMLRLTNENHLICRRDLSGSAVGYSNERNAPSGLGRYSSTFRSEPNGPSTTWREILGLPIG